MRRLTERRDLTDLKSDVLFGLILGWVFTLIGGFRHYFLLDGAVWLYVACLGLLILATAVVAPQLLGYPRAVLNAVVGAAANLLFKQLVIGLYVILVLPIGIRVGMHKPVHPFYSWTERAPDKIEGWVDKV